MTCNTHILSDPSSITSSGKTNLTRSILNIFVQNDIWLLFSFSFIHLLIHSSKIPSSFTWMMAKTSKVFSLLKSILNIAARVKIKIRLWCFLAENLLMVSYLPQGKSQRPCSGLHPILHFLIIHTIQLLWPLHYYYSSNSSSLLSIRTLAPLPRIIFPQISTWFAPSLFSGLSSNITLSAKPYYIFYNKIEQTPHTLSTSASLSHL